MFTARLCSGEKYFTGRLLVVHAVEWVDKISEF